MAGLGPVKTHGLSLAGQPDGQTNTRLDAIEAGVYNVSRYGALPGLPASSTGINAAITAANADGGGIVYVPPGSYNLDAQIDLKSNVILRGAGMDVSVFEANSGFTGSLVRGNSISNNRVEDLTLDGNNEAGITNGIVYYTGNGTKKNFTLQRCRLRQCDQTRGLNVWTAERLWILNNRIEDCVEGLYIDTPTNDVLIQGNHVSGDGVAQQGIVVRASSTREAGVRVIGNMVNDITEDPSGIGTSGYGINIVNCRGVIVANNSLDNINEGGIHIGSGSAGSTVVGNRVRAASQGIYCEQNFGVTDIGTGGAIKGAMVIGNTCFECTSYGISVSYGAGSIVKGNTCYSNANDGIITDSDRVIIEGNLCYNNNTNSSFSPNVLTQAGIRAYGSRCIIKNNVCFDNQTVKTQAYGIAAGNSNHIIEGNVLRDNLTGSLWQADTQTGTSKGIGASNRVVGNATSDSAPTVTAAATITLPSEIDVITVTGNTGITSVAASSVGRLVTLVFTGTPTVTDGSNLKLAGNFVAAGTTNDADTLTLRCDGTNWYEVARSTN